MSFNVTILGSSSAIPTAKRFPTAQVLNVHERFFLIDCGEGTQIQLRRFSVNIARINHLFISHLHGDHIFGLFGLLSSYTLLGRKTAFHIFAHRDLEATLNHYKEHFGKELTFEIIFHPFLANKNTVIYDDRHMSVEILPLRHSVPVAGFIFREKQRALNIRKDAIVRYGIGIKDIRNIKDGKDFVAPSGEIIKNSELTLPPYKPRSYAFCTDTSCFSKLTGWLKEIDLLYFEATFSNADRKLAKITGHSTSVQAAKLAKEAGVGKLIMGHFSIRYKSVSDLVKEARDIFPESYAVEDGENYSVKQVRIESPV
jgi:ribonuclease Z